MLPLLLLLNLLRFLPEAYSQTVPYVSFMGQTLANHSFVDLSLVGSVASNSIQCHTDLPTCCISIVGLHCGDWYFPDGARLPFTSGDITERHGIQTVHLRVINSATSPSGIYRCDVPTVAVHDDDDISVRETVYVGAYTAGGGNVTKHMKKQTCGQAAVHVGIIISLCSLTIYLKVERNQHHSIYSWYLNHSNNGCMSL